MATPSLKDGDHIEQVGMIVFLEVGPISMTMGIKHFNPLRCTWPTFLCAHGSIHAYALNSNTIFSPICTGKIGVPSLQRCGPKQRQQSEPETFICRREYGEGKG